MTDDSAKVAEYFEVARFFRKRDLERAIGFGQQGRALAEYLGLRTQVLRGRLVVGRLYYRQSDYMHAREEYEEAAHLAEQLADKEQQSYALDRLGMCYNYLGQYGVGANYCLRALKLAEEVGDQDQIAVALNDLTIIYKNQKEYEQALEYGKRSLRIREQMKDTTGVASSLHNLGTVLQRLGKYNEAQIYYFKALDLNRMTGNLKWMSYNYNNIGNTYQGEGDFNKAIRFHTKSLELKRETDHRHGMAIGFLNLGEDFQLMGDGRKALAYTDSALAISHDLANPDLESAILRVRANAYYAAGQYDMAFQLLQRHHALNDSIAAQEQSLTLADLEDIFLSESKEHEDELRVEREARMETQISLRDRTILASMILLLALLVTSVVLYRNYQLKIKSNKTLRAQNDAIMQQDQQIKKQQEEILTTNALLEENNQNLQLAIRNMREASQAKARFLSTMSHEIRTPLNAILGMAHLLLEEVTDSKGKDQLRIINFSAKNLLALVNDILDFSKIEAGKVDFENRDFDLHELIKNSLESFRYSADDKHIELRNLLDEEVPVFVNGDSVRLSQILVNLMGNAVKFTEQGSVQVRVKVKKETKEKLTILFEVEDTGIGIPYEEQENIFEQFTQAEADTTRKFGGSGLGLTIVKQLVELQGGKMSLVSIPGVGSTFSFTLPFGRASNKIVSKEGFIHYADQSISGKRVLLVEDNVINQKVTTNFLDKWGVEVVLAGNGKEALKTYLNRTFDVILMDLRMPGMDGFEVAEKIRAMKDPVKSQVPIIALTASAMLEVRDQVFIVGMNDYVTKPFNPDDLFVKLKRWLVDKQTETKQS